MAAADAVIRHLRRHLGTPASDAGLLRAYAERREEDAFRALVERHGPMVLGLCRRRLGDAHAAEDAFQATFLSLARSAASVRRPEALAGWLARTALRVCGKAQAIAAKQRLAEARTSIRTASDPPAELTARELLAALDAELHRLPERYRTPLILVYWQGRTHADAARQLNLSEGALHGRLDRGRKRLADRLRRRGFGPDAATRALLVVGAGAVTVPGDLVAQTVTFAAAPWSKALPAAILALTATATPSPIAPAAALAVLLAGVGAIGLVASRDRERTEEPPPVARAPDAPDQPRGDLYGDPLPPGALLRLGTRRYRSDHIAHLSARAGRQVAFQDERAVVFMNADTGQTVRRIDPGTRLLNGRECDIFLTALTFAPDGRSFAVGYRYAQVDPPAPRGFSLYDVAHGNRLREFSGQDQSITALAFLAGGLQIASLGGDGVVRIWDAATAAKLRELSRPECKFESLVATPDGRMLATGAEARDGKAAVYLWDAAGGRLLHTLAGHTAAVQALAFAPDGRTLASGGKATIRLWDVTTGRELRRFAAPAKEVPAVKPLLHSIAFSPDGQLIAAARTDTSIRVWSVADGQVLDQTDQFSSFPLGLAFLDERTLLISGGYTLLLRDVAARSFKNRADGSESGIGRVGISPDGRTIATADTNSTVHTWDARDGRHLSAKTWSPWTIITLVSPDGRLVAFTDGYERDAVTCLGDVATGRVVRRLPEKNQHPVAFSSDGRRLITCVVVEPKSPDAADLHVWDTQTATKLGQIRAGFVPLSALALTPNGRSLFTGESEQHVKRWDLTTGRAVTEFLLGDNQNRTGANTLTLSPAGRRLMVGCTDDTIRVWDTVTRQECWRATVKGAKLMHAAAFSADGTLVAAGHYDNDGQVDLLDARTGRRLARVSGHHRRQAVTDLAFSTNGRRLVSASSDCTALVWDVEAVIGRRLRPLDDARQTQLWDDLGGDPAAVAHAIDCWQAGPDAAVPFLRGKLKPIVAVLPDRVAGLLADLDSGSFATREAASKALERLGPGATGSVRAALAKTSSAEVKRRAQAALDAWEQEGRRAAHAVEILEYVATPDAQQLLERLAAGDPAARLTREAQSGLDRLQRR
jgi:RNA polymerase sigma factor (sigma-70 family)